MSKFCISIASVCLSIIFYDHREKNKICFLFCRYQFLVYNASVIYFNSMRPFFRDGFRQYLCESFQQVVDTLINLEDEHDYAWQAELLL